MPSPTPPGNRLTLRRVKAATPPAEVSVGLGYIRTIMLPHVEGPSGRQDSAPLGVMHFAGIRSSGMGVRIDVEEDRMDYFSLRGDEGSIIRTREIVARMSMVPPSPRYFGNSAATFGFQMYSEGILELAVRVWRTIYAAVPSVQYPLASYHIVLDSSYVFLFVYVDCEKVKGLTAEYEHGGEGLRAREFLLSHEVDAQMNFRLALTRYYIEEHYRPLPGYR